MLAWSNPASPDATAGWQPWRGTGGQTIGGNAIARGGGNARHAAQHDRSCLRPTAGRLDAPLAFDGFVALSERAWPACLTSVECDRDMCRAPTVPTSSGSIRTDMSRPPGDTSRRASRVSQRGRPGRSMFGGTSWRSCSASLALEAGALSERSACPQASAEPDDAQAGRQPQVGPYPRPGAAASRAGRADGGRAGPGPGRGDQGPCASPVLHRLVDGIMVRGPTLDIPQALALCRALVAGDMSLCAGAPEQAVTMLLTPKTQGCHGPYWSNHGTGRPSDRA